MTTHKGLGLDVYRPATGRDATLNGITSTHTRVTLIGTIDTRGRFTPSPKCARVGLPTEDSPAVALRARATSAHLLPVTPDGTPAADPIWFMSGGNYAATTDSRVRDYYRELGMEPIYGAIPVHDRWER